MNQLNAKIGALLVAAASLVFTTGSFTTTSAATPSNDDIVAGGVLVGPCGVPGAEGPTGTNDDFTNGSINKGIVNVAPGGLTTAPGTIVFRNTIQNIGTGDDAYVLSAPSAPDGFKVEMSIDDGANYVIVEPWSTGVTMSVSYRAATTFFVRITAPAGLPVLTGFDTVIRATSMTTSTATNDTIDRLYTGFIRLDKTMTIVNATGAGGPTDPVSGAEIEFAVNYSNVSSANGVGSSSLTAQHIVINENGNASPNNWGSTTDQIVGASDTRGGIIIGDRNGSSSLSDIITTLEAGQSGVFKFKRKIK